MDEIIITEYDPNWVRSFDRESASIRAMLDRDLVRRIEQL
jgi:GrpB-like predicted nucleotidyltransferase (UPF0157 family)